MSEISKPQSHLLIGRAHPIALDPFMGAFSRNGYKTGPITYSHTFCDINHDIAFSWTHLVIPFAGEENS